MSLETATFTDDLDNSNPTATDPKGQGDDHLRLLKTVIKNSLKRVTRAFYVPGISASKTVDFTVAASDDNRTFLVDTTAGAIAATLPTLAAADAGWECCFIKTNTGTNALFITPASGTIQSGEVSGLSKTRRCIPGHKTRVYWTGTAWYAERVVRSPVGSIIDCPITALPVGYEWANGQTLSSAANYPDFNSANGSLIVQDRKGRSAFGRDDMGGAAAGRITNALSGIVGTTLGASGGAESVVMLQANLPNVNFTHSGTIITDHPTHGHNVHQAGASDVNCQPVGTSQGIGGPAPTAAAGSYTTNDASGNAVINPAAAMAHTVSAQGVAASGGSATAINKMPPAIISNFIVVVE